MRQAAVLGIACILIAAGSSFAAEPFAEARLATIRAAYAAGKYDEAVTGARSLMTGTKDDSAKIEAMRILADSLRKQGEWRLAAKAYSDLKDRFEKGSADHVRCEATVEVLQTSPKGVYAATAAKSGSTAALSDDGALAEALVHVGDARAEKLKVRVAAMKKSNSAKDIAAALTEVVQGYKQARILDAKLPVELDRDAAQAAGAALERIENQVVVPIRDRISELEQSAMTKRTISNTQRKQAMDYQGVCQEMVDAENAFRGVLGQVGGFGWPEGRTLFGASFKRSVEYGRMLQASKRLQAVDLFGGRW
jgi:hypothetical protein